MNASLANLTAPPKSAANAAPAKKSPGRAVADRSDQQPKAAAHPDADAKARVRPETPVGQVESKPAANSRKTDRKTDRAKLTGEQTVLTDQNVVTQHVAKSAPVGSEAVFAAILQAAGQSDPAVAGKNAAQTKAIAPNAGQTEPQVGARSQSATPELALNAAGVNAAKLEQIAHSASALAANHREILKASAKASSIEGSESQSASAIMKNASRSAADDAGIAMPKTAVDPNTAVDGEALKRFSLGLKQGVQPAGAKTGQAPGPNTGASVRNSAKLQNNSLHQAQIAGPDGPHISASRLAVLSQMTDRQAKTSVNEFSGPAAGRIIPQTAAPTEGVLSAEAAGPRAVETASPVRQIADAFRASADRNGQEIVIRLDPPELGRVCVKLRMDGNEVRGVLDVDNPRTLSQLQREAPNIIGRLTEAGVEMKRMDVSLSQDSQRDSGWFSQQSGQHGPGDGRWSAPNQEFTADGALPGEPDDPDEHRGELMAIGSDSINVWI